MSLRETSSLMGEFNLPADVAAEILDLARVEYRQQVEQCRWKLIELEEQYRSILQLSADVIAIHQDGKVVFVNNSAVRAWGATSPAEMVGRDVFSFIHPDSIKAVRYRIDKMTKEGVDAEVLEEKLLARDGTVLVMDVVAAPITYMGEPAIVMVAENEALGKDMTETFRTISDDSPSGIAIIQDRQFRYVNRQMQKMTGYSEEELLSSGTLTFVLAADRQKVRRNSAKVLAGEVAPPYIYRAVKKNGEVVWVMESMTLIQYTGRPAILANFLDVTER